MGYDEYINEWVGNFLTKQWSLASDMIASIYFYLRVAIDNASETASFYYVEVCC